MEQVRKFGAGFTLIGCSRLKIDKPALGVNVSSIRPNGITPVAISSDAFFCLSLLLLPVLGK